MSRVLLIGPAGSGKTHRLLNEFVSFLKESPHPLEGDAYFVLPSAEHTERVTSLVVQRGVPGFFNERVTTLSRLLPRLFAVADHDLASNVTRYLMLRDLMESQAWDYFREVRAGAGFLNLILGWLMELKDSLIGPEIFRERMNEMKRLEPAFAMKYEALAGLYEGYEAALKKRGLRDRQDAFARYLETKKKRARMKKTGIRKIWLDGFFDFTELQAAYLEELCEMTDSVTVSLTLDPAPARRELFEVFEETVSRLRKMDFKTEFQRGKNRRAVSSSLAALENSLFSGRTKKKPAARRDASVQVLEAIGMEGEIEMIAREIERLSRTGTHRFSDMALLFRQLGDYESVIRSVFSRYAIPVEIHEREKLGFAPMIQVVTHLLRTLREGWRRQDLMDFLKSSYVRFLGSEPKEYEWVSALEHRSQREGVFRGREAWLGGWQSDGSEEDRVFLAEKDRKLGVLAELEDRLRNAKTFGEIRRAMTEAMETRFGIFEPMDSLEEYVRRDAASYRRFLSLLDETERSFAEPASGEAGDHEVLSFDRFADRFLRLTELDLYSLHEKDKNRVQVYDISLARQKEYRVVFVAGLLEKRFPVQMREDALLSDWERRLFNGRRKQGILKERLPRQKLERYLFYLAVTRASERLFLSYPRLDLEGKESLPSYYVREAASLFKEGLPVKKQELGQPYPDFRETVNWRELEMAVVGELWTMTGREASQARPLLFYLTNALLKREDSRRRIEKAFYEVKAQLTDPRIRDTGAFKASRMSATRLEDYGKCAFKYFARRVLRLVDTEEDTNITRRGLILHDVLEHYFTDWTREKPAVPDLEKEKKKIFVLLEETLPKYPLLAEKRYQYDLEVEDLRDLLSRFLEYELPRLQDSPLSPRYFEYAFGLPESPAPALDIETADEKVFIAGKIDRIDVDPKGQAGAVIDYKRTASFKRADLDLGISLQIPIYLMALERFLHLKPAAAELYSIRECKKKGIYHKEYLPLFPETKSRQNLLDEKEFRKVLEQSAAFIRRYAGEIRGMNIAVRPRSCDSFCPYSAVCRIEKWKLPLILDEIKKDDAKRESDFRGRPVTGGART